MSEQPPGLHNRGIFRPAAVQHYLQHREEVVFLHPVSRRTLSFLWLALGVLGLGLIAFCSIQMPLYSSGSAKVVSTHVTSVTLTVTLPATEIGKVHEGQAIYLSDGSSQLRLRGHIVVVEHAPSRGDVTAQQRYWSTDIPVSTPSASALLLAELDTSTVTPAHSICGNCLYTIEVETGLRTIGSFLLTFTERRT